MPENVKWYLRTSTLITAFLLLGPLALPLVWINPRFNPLVKTVISVIVIVFGVILSVALFHALKVISQYYGMIANGGQGL